MENLQETQQAQESGGTANVVTFPPGAHRCKREQPQATDEELAEYRRIRPILMQIIEQWPALAKEHRVITQSCPLAIKLLRSAD